MSIFKVRVELEVEAIDHNDAIVLTQEAIMDCIKIIRIETSNRDGSMVVKK